MAELVVRTERGEELASWVIPPRVAWGDELEAALPGVINALQHAVDLEAGESVEPKDWDAVARRRPTRGSIWPW